MFVRRRPLLRAAAIGGGAYMAGKRRAERSAWQQEQESEQDARTSSLERDQTQPGGELAGGTKAAVPRQAAPASMSEQLSQLSDLHEHGALTDAEFASAKSRLLGS